MVGPFENHGPYPEDWSEHDRELWDTEPNTFRELYDADEWEDLQEAFYHGWLETGIPKEEHREWQERWYDISGVDPGSFDWEAFREWADKESPTAA